MVVVNLSHLVKSHAKDGGTTLSVCTVVSDVRHVSTLKSYAAHLFYIVVVSSKLVGSA